MRKQVWIGLFFALFGFMASAQENGGSSAESLAKVRQWFDRFEDFLGRTDLITPGQLQKLPVGLRTTVGNTYYDLLVTQAVFGPETTELALFLRISGPDWQGEDRKLYFGADKVLISSRGGYIGDVKLALLGDVTLKGKGDMFQLHFKGRKEEGNHTNTSDGLPPTYAIVNCEGFKELQLSAVLELNGDLFAAVKKGKLTEDPLQTSFFCAAKSLDDILIKIDIPEFALRSIPDWTFLAQDVMLDFSQTRNAPGFKQYALRGNEDAEKVDFGEIWQGLYLKKMRLQFPDYIRKKDGNSPSVLAENFWIDEKGLTGKVAAEKILMLDEGSLGGWGFSIEKFQIDFLQSKLTGGGMDGSIELPVSKAGKYSYEAYFEKDGSWNMKLGLGEKVHFDFLKAKEVELYNTSYIQAKKEKDKPLLLKASLSGKMKLNPMARENERFGFANLEFKNMVIQNQTPYFEVARIDWDDELRIKNFPVSIRDISITGKKKDISLSLKTLVHFGDKESASFGGELGLSIHSAVKEEEERQRWDFEKIEFGDAKVDFSNPFLTFKGSVRLLDDDPVYGDGFQGSIDVGIKPLEIGLRGDMMIGSKETYRYWYVDMLANLGAAGIPVFPGFKISAIGGGAYQRMRIESSDPKNTSQKGKTSTGLYYVPDSTRALGVKTSLVLATLNEKLFNAELTMEMAFNQSGGLSDMYLRGVGQLMAKDLQALKRFNQRVLQLASQIQPSLETQQRSVASEAAVTAQVEMQIDVENRRFTGNFDAFMDLGVIKGAGSKGLLGRLGMSFGQGDWHIKVGEPAHPLGVKMKVGPLQASLDAYFMTGSSLPAFPGMPEKVASLLGHSRYTRPSLSDLEKGSGFAFGANFNLSTGTIPLLVFYAAFDAEVGFDVMLKQHLNSLCIETGQEPGINGWYAQGQAYAYLMADIGLYLKLFGKKRNFSVLKGEVGALLSAGLPNPSSFAGGIGLNVSILNGLVKGRFHLDFDLGQSCTVLNQGFADGAEIIAGIQPQKGEERVDVFCVPQAAFNLPIETEIMEEYDNKEKLLKLNLEQYEFWYGGTRLDGKLQWNEDKRVVEFHSHDILPPETRIDCKLAIKAREKQGASWRDLTDPQGGSYREERDWFFTTGEGPDSIPWNNVKYTYPVRDQKYFLPGEHKKGFVFLERGMAGLLTNPDYRKRIYLVSAADTLEASFTYNQAERRLAWFMPEGLKPQTRYDLLLVMQYTAVPSVPVANAVSDLSSGSAESSSSRIQTSGTTLYEGQGGTLTQETVQMGSSLLKSDKDKIILRYGFTTSRYSDFSSKMAAVNLTETYRTPLLSSDENGHVYTTMPDVHYLQAEMKSGEAFCEMERLGGRYSGNQPLVRPLAVLGTEKYFVEDIEPLVYREYPYQGVVSFIRSPEHPEVVPDWAVYPSSLYDTDSKDYFPWIYYQAVQYKEDFNSVLCGIANAGIMGLPYYYSWLGKHFKPMRKGVYPIVLRYVLPDGTVTSQSRIVFENKVD